MTKKIIIIGLVAGLLAPALPVLAESEGQKGTQKAEAEEPQPECNLQPYLGYLQEIQSEERSTEEPKSQEAEEPTTETQPEEADESATSTEPETDTATSTEPQPQEPQLPDELTVRRELLIRVLDCTILDANELKAEVQDLDLVGAEENALQDRFVKRIESAISYYEEQKEQVKREGLDIGDMKSAAVNVRYWRSNTYNQLQRNTQNFFMWVQNQSLLDTAQTRLSSVRETIKRFNLGRKDLIEESFDRASFFVDRARDQHRETQTALVHDKDPKMILEELKDTTSDLYRAYREFFTLSGTVRGYLLTR